MKKLPPQADDAGALLSPQDTARVRLIFSYRDAAARDENLYVDTAAQDERVLFECHHFYMPLSLSKKKKLKKK